MCSYVISSGFHRCHTFCDDGTVTINWHNISPNNILTLLICRFPFVMKLCQGNWIDVEPFRCIHFCFVLFIRLFVLPVKNLVEWHRALARFYHIQNPGKIQKMFFQTTPKCHQPEYLQMNKIKQTINFIFSLNTIILCKSIFYRITIVFAIKDPINIRMKWIPFIVHFQP